jgi:hypothetical protein
VGKLGTSVVMVLVLAGLAIVLESFSVVLFLVAGLDDPQLNAGVSALVAAVIGALVAERVSSARSG